MPEITYNPTRFRRSDRLAFLVVAAAAVSVAAVLPSGGILIAAGLALLGVIALLYLRPDAAVLLVVFVIYTNAAGVAVRFHGVPLAVAATFPLLLLWPLYHSLVVQRQGIALPATFWWAVAFVLAQSVGLMFAAYPEDSFKVVATSIAEGLALFFLVVNTVRTRVVLQTVVWGLLLAGGLLGGLAGFQHLTGTFDNNYFGFAQVGYDVTLGSGQHLYSQPRLAGPIGVENRHAHLMLLLVPLGLVQFLGDRRLWPRAAAAVLTLLITLGIGLTYSRGAAIGLGAIVAALAVFRLIRVRRLSQLVLVGLVVLAALPEYRSRLASLGRTFTSVGSQSRDSSVEGRLNEAVTAGLIFASNPIFGVGPGMYAYHYEDYKHRAGRGQHAGKRLAHNLYLGLAAEHGVVGLLCFLAVIGTTWKRLMRARREHRSASPNLPLAFLLVLIAYLTTGMFADLAYVRYFWLMLALANVACAVTDSEQPEMLIGADAANSDGDFYAN